MAEESKPEGIQMPEPTTAPLILGVGIVLLGAGVALNLTLSIVGAVVFIAGLAGWIGHLMPGRGHFHEERVPPQQRPQELTGAPGTVEQLETGMPGYRMRLPLKIHPISAGIKGGLLGGLVMPVPALLWGLISRHGIWYPINLLAGMVLAGVEDMPVEDLEQFHFSLLVVGLVIHAAMSLVVGLIYGVLLPTLPEIPNPMSWGALLMPLLWTAVSFSLMGNVNPVLQQGVSWPWFIISQFVFGVVLATVVMGAENLGPIRAGILGGITAGLLMAVPAFLWALVTGHGIWYPINLLAGMVVPGMDAESLREFQGSWFAMALLIHAALSIGFGLALSHLAPRLPVIPGPIASGALLLPILWSGASYGLMGVVNPRLQLDVDWPSFIASQFVFGVTAAIVVMRTEKIAVAPAGTGPDKGPQ
jgi:hypothetical protein